MTRTNNYYIEKLRRLRYLNRGVVFALDLFFSVFGTILAYIYVLAFFQKDRFDGSITTIVLCSAIVSAVLFLSTGIYKVIIRHSTIKELPKIFYILASKEIILGLLLWQLKAVDAELIIFCAIMDMLFTSFLMIGVRAFVVNVYYSIINSDGQPRANVFMYSTEGRSPMLAEQINKNITIPYIVQGFLTTNKKKNGIKIVEETVHYLDGDSDKLLKLFRDKHITCIVFTSNENFDRERNRLVEFCITNHIKMLMAGNLETIDGKNNLQHTIKPIQIEDLLERDEIIVETERIAKQLENKVVLVTGAAGSIGREIATQLAKFDVKQLIFLDNAETPMHNLQLEMERCFPCKNMVYRLGDVRAKETINGVFKEYRPSIVFHAAAYKHVPMIERNPCEAILVNVWGTVNIARHAVEYGVEKFVMVSTDKAVNPTNVMGASKRLAEICVQNLFAESSTKFITTRFGNVLGSNGSVIPRFKEQISTGGPITVTHPDIIRYFMTIPEACRLVLQAATMGQGGEIFVFDMGEQVKIADLARRMILLSGLEPDKDIKIEYTGLRPGEKLYEELLTSNEKTDTTNHEKIRIAHSSTFSIEVLNVNLKRLIASAVRVDIDKTILMMKILVPEFISQNSEFEKYDK